MEKVVLYGVGLEGEQFYCKYKNTYQFVYAIDRNGNRTFHDLKVYNLEEVKEDLKNYFIYVAMEDTPSWIEARDTLQNIGLIEFDKFSSVKCANRKLAVFYGNCHVAHLMRYMRVNPAFDRAFATRYYFYDGGELLQKNNKVLKQCNLLITQDILSTNKLGLPSAEELISRVSAEHCISIKIPNLFGYNLFFPQLKVCEEELNNYRCRLHVNENAIDYENHQVADSFGATLLWKDICIEDMYSRGGG